MRPLADKPNTDAPDSDYPFGKIRDNPGNNTGTPINEVVYGDIHQFFEKLMNAAAITPNGLPENQTNGFQLYEALLKVTRQEYGKDTIQFIIDGGGAAIATGQYGHVEVPFNCEIVGARLFGNTSGSIAIDVWKSTYGTFPPVDGGSITASAPPTLTAANKSEDTTLTGWTKTLTKGDVLAFNVDSVSGLQRVTIVLDVLKT